MAKRTAATHRESTTAPPKAPRQQNSPADSLHTLQDRLGYRFRNRDLLELALTHRSLAEEQGRNETDADNEQLEFLGDSVLDLHVTELLLERFGHRREGDLTRMRAMLVSREALSHVGVRLCLGEALRMGADLDSSGGRQKVSLLANTVEAVLAAMYRDSAPDGFAATAAFVRREIFEPHLPDLLRIAEDGANFGIMGDWKSALQELLQARGVGVPTYRNVAELGESQQDRRFVEEVLVEGRVMGRGEARNRKAAQKAAAAEAFQRLQANAVSALQPFAEEAPAAPAATPHRRLQQPA